MRTGDEGNPEDIGDLSIEEYMKGEKSDFYQPTKSFYDVVEYIHHDPNPFFSSMLIQDPIAAAVQDPVDPASSFHQDIVVVGWFVCLYVC